MRTVIRACVSLWLSLLVLQVSDAQVVQEKQMSLILKKTATWCPNCGSWGWTWFKDLIGDTEGEAWVIALHSTSSDLKPPADLDGALIAQFTGNGGFPTFFVNGVGKSTYEAIADAVTANASADPTAGLGIETGYDAGTVQIQGRVEFFKPYSGDLSVAYYLVEDSLVHQQAAQGANAVHRFVLKDVLGGLPFGQVMSVDAQPGADVQFTRDVDLPGLPVSRTGILGVIWKKTGSSYTYMNSWYSALTAGPLSSVETGSPDEPTDVSLAPNPATPGDGLRFSLSGHLPAGPVQATLVAPGGQKVSEMSWTEGAVLTIPSHCPPGVYGVMIRSTAGLMTLPLVIR